MGYMVDEDEGVCMRMGEVRCGWEVRVVEGGRGFLRVVMVGEGGRGWARVFEGGDGG